MREATAREREAVRDFARLALGEDATASTEDKVRATLHAASVDDAVRERLEAGRLERDAEAGADPMALLSAGAGAKSGAKSRPSGTAKARGSGTTKARGSGARRRAAPAPRRRTAPPPRSRSARSRPTRSSGGRRRPSARRRPPTAR